MLSRRLRFGDGAGNLFRNGTYRLLMRDLERDKACAWQERAWAGALRAYLGHRTSQTVLYSLWRALAYHCDEAISAAHVYGCRIRSNGTGGAMRPRTRRHGRHYSSLCAIRGPCAWTARHIRARPGGYGANGTPSVHPRAFLFGRIYGRPGSYWPRPDNIAAVYSRTDDPSRSAQVR